MCFLFWYKHRNPQRITVLLLEPSPCTLLYRQLYILWRQYGYSSQINVESYTQCVYWNQQLWHGILLEIYSLALFFLKMSKGYFLADVTSSLSKKEHPILLTTKPKTRTSNTIWLDFIYVFLYRYVCFGFATHEFTA